MPAPLKLLSETSADSWSRILKIALELYKIQRKFAKAYNKAIGKVTDMTSDVLDDLSRRTLSALGDAMSAMGNVPATLVDTVCLM